MGRSHKEIMHMRNSVLFLAAIFLTASTALQAEEMFECPQESSKIGLSFSADYLYWKTQEEQLYPVIFVKSSDSEQTQQEISPTNQKFEYTSGFRVALGYEFPCTSYDIKFAWTRIHPRTTAKFESPDPKMFIAIPFSSLTDSDVPHAGSVVSRWHLNYDMLDLDLGREYALCNCFTFRPHIGLKGGWINQTQKMQVNDITLGQSPVIDITQGTAHRRNDFNGIGPSIGVDMRFALGSQFGVFGGVSGALLYGQFDLMNKIFIADTLNNYYELSGPKTINLESSEYFVSPTVQVLLGGDWATCFCEKYWIRLGVAYEVLYWWDQMKSNNSINQTLFVNSPSGNLMMHGLTVQASFEF